MNAVSYTHLLVGVVLLSIMTDEGKPLLNFGEAMSKGVSWPSLIMCAGTTAVSYTHLDVYKRQIQ